MKRQLMELLVCPLCKGELRLTSEKENEKEIVEGDLFCQKCNEHYPIEDTVPNMLPSDRREAFR